MRICWFAVEEYVVKVFTGQDENAGTDANVYVTLFGTQGDTGERWLNKSTNHFLKFQPTQVQNTIFTS